MESRAWRFPREIGFDSVKIEVQPSGFPSLDEFMLLKKNAYELITIAALPGAGKSQLALQIAANVAENHNVLFFSTEMSANMLNARLVASRHNIPLKNVMEHKFDGYTDNFSSAKLDISMLNLAFVDNFERKPESVFRICVHFSVLNPEPIALIVIDQMPQFIAAMEGHEGVMKLTHAFKGLAKKFKCPVLQVAQLNRRNPKTSAEDIFTPSFNDLKGSSSIEQDSDIVITLTQKPDCNQTRLNILKNKNGMPGYIDLTWRGDLVKFTDPKSGPVIVQKPITKEIKCQTQQPQQQNLGIPQKR